MLTVKYLSQSSNQDGLLWWLSSNLPASAGVSGSIPASKRSPREGNGNRTSILPGKTHGERSLAGHSPLGCKRVAHDLATQNTHQRSIPMFFVCVCAVRTQDFLSWQISSCSKSRINYSQQAAQNSPEHSHFMSESLYLWTKISHISSPCPTSR